MKHYNEFTDLTNYVGKREIARKNKEYNEVRKTLAEGKPAGKYTNLIDFMTADSAKIHRTINEVMTEADYYMLLDNKDAVIHLLTYLDELIEVAKSIDKRLSSAVDTAQSIRDGIREYYVHMYTDDDSIERLISRNEEGRLNATVEHAYEIQQICLKAMEGDAADLRLLQIAWRFQTLAEKIEQKTSTKCNRQGFVK